MVQIPFEKIWSRIQKELYSGLIIPNWGFVRGLTGNKFKVERITENAVVCDPPNAKNRQYVPKDDFKIIWEVWDLYLQYEVKRYEIAEISRFSSYIISIFNFLGLS